MKNVYQSLILLIAGATQQELARQVRYLKVENEILRSKLPKRVTVTPKERNRLAKFAVKLGSALNELASIAHPSTIRRWIREAAGGAKKSTAKRGRPKTKDQIRELILTMARENDWGYTRIMGELKKLGITPPSRNTVKNILKENGLEPGPKRGEGTWDDFLKQHAATLWQCDFYAKKALTLKGFRDLYILVFLHVESRRVYITPSTFHPNEDWVKQQAVAFLDHLNESDLDIKLMMHDRDTKFTASFDALFDQAGADTKKTAFRSPNTNAYVERYIQTLQQEVLDHFVVFGEQHMDHLVSEAREYYHEERPHQAKDNELLIRNVSDASEIAESEETEILCRERLGGLLRHYYQKAA